MAKKYHLINREIGIDAGHRVTHHGSKCKNLHGHRYTIQAVVKGELFDQGEQQGMVLDYGFLKEIMMDHIDTPCDHGMILWDQDPWTAALVPEFGKFNMLAYKKLGYASIKNNNDQNTGGKFYIVPFVPTAENLSKHWFERLSLIVTEQTQGKGKLQKIIVWETPNCSASYPADKE